MQHSPAPHGSQPPGGVPLLDVGRGNQPLLEEMRQAIEQVLDSGQFVFGPQVRQLEEAMAQLAGVPHGVGCASGSDALLLALMAANIGPGDEVIVPSFTFFATASAVWRLGAELMFADIDPVTFNIDPASVEGAITPRTRAIVPVHLFGQCVDMQPLLELAGKHDLFLVEDACQAIGAGYRDQRAGGIGQIGCFSFYPTKNLGGLGDGGMLTTGDDHLADRLQLLRGHGMRPRYYHSEVGINSRLDTIQAAALLVKLAHLPAWNGRRQALAARYQELFAAAGLDGELTLPSAQPRCDHVWNQYTIRVAGGRRDEIRAALAEMNIGSEIYYPVPLHRQQCFEGLGYPAGSLPETERAAGEVLSLPIFPELTESEQEQVVSGLAAALSHRLRKSA